MNATAVPTANPADSITGAGSAICREVRNRRGRAGSRCVNRPDRGARTGTISTIPSAATPIRTHEFCLTPDSSATAAGIVTRRKTSIVLGPVGNIC